MMKLLLLLFTESFLKVKSRECFLWERILIRWRQRRFQRLRSRCCFATENLKVICSIVQLTNPKFQYFHSNVLIRKVNCNNSIARYRKWIEILLPMQLSVKLTNWIKDSRGWRHVNSYSDSLAAREKFFLISLSYRELPRNNNWRACCKRVENLFVTAILIMSFIC